MKYRILRTSDSVTPQKLASCLSEKPASLASFITSLFLTLPDYKETKAEIQRKRHRLSLRKVLINMCMRGREDIEEERQKRNIDGERKITYSGADLSLSSMRVRSWSLCRNHLSIFVRS